MDERRLSPRRQMQGHWVAVPVAESIRILDLSLSGAARNGVSAGP
jgi:hypothetical protein